MIDITEVVKHLKIHTFFISLIILLSFFCCFSVSADDNVLMINPSSQTVSSDNIFTVNVRCNPVEPIKGYELIISFDPIYIQALSVTEGDFFDGYDTFFNPGDIDNSNGFINNIYGLIIGPGNISNPGIFCNISFSADVYSGSSPIKFNKVGKWTGITNETSYLPMSVVDGSVTVNGLYEPPIPPPPPPPNGSEEPVANNAPNPPVKPIGPTSIESDVEYSYYTYSTDIDDDLVKIRFDWGDGSFSDWSSFFPSNASIYFTHSWNNTSIFSIKAMAQDINLSNSSWSEVLNVIVSESAGLIEPVPVLGIFGNNTVNETIYFDASSSFDPDGVIVSYYWDFGDGTNATGVNVTHSYKNPGMYIINLIITDFNNNTYNTSIKLDISNGPSNDIIEEKTNDLGTPIFWIWVIIGIFIISLFLVIIVFRRKLKDVISDFSVNLNSRMILWNNRRRIDTKNNSNNLKGLKMGYSTDELIKNAISIDFEKKPDSFNKEFYPKSYDYGTSDKYDEILHDSLKSKPLTVKKDRQGDIDINEIVDRLLPSKSWGKANLDISDIEKRIDDIISFKEKSYD